MVTGRPPFDFPTLTRICAELATENPPPPMSRVVPDLPPALEAAVQQSFVRDREKRTQNVAELAGGLLEAVEAPFANQVRQRIATVLDPKGLAGGLLTTSGALTLSTGNYRSLSITGSSRPNLSSSSAIRMAAEQSPSSAATAAGVEALVATDSGKAKKKGVVVGAAIGLLAVAGLAFAFVGGQHSKDSPAPASVANRPSAPTPPPPPVVTPVAAPVAPAATAAPAPPAPTAAQVAAPAPAPAPGRPAPHRGWGGGGGGRATPAPPSPPPAASAASAPAPAPAAPAPKPAPTAKVNPLDDRQ
jgi:hypothetical protein